MKNAKRTNGSIFARPLGGVWGRLGSQHPSPNVKTLWNLRLGEAPALLHALSSSFSYVCTCSPLLTLGRFAVGPRGPPLHTSSRVVAMPTLCTFLDPDRGCASPYENPLDLCSLARNVSHHVMPKVLAGKRNSCTRTGSPANCHGGKSHRYERIC